MSLQLNLIAIVLLAAVTHALWNAIVKISGDRFLTATAVLGSDTVFGVFFLPLVPVPTPVMCLFLMGSVTIHAVYHLCLINAYRFGDLTQVLFPSKGKRAAMSCVAGSGHGWRGSKRLGYGGDCHGIGWHRQPFL